MPGSVTSSPITSSHQERERRNPQDNNTARQSVLLTSSDLYDHLRKLSLCASPFCQMFFSLLNGMQAVFFLTFLSERRITLRRIAVYMTLHFRWRFEVSQRGLFASPPVRLRAAVWGRMFACIILLIYLFSGTPLTLFAGITGGESCSVLRPSQAATAACHF